MRSGSQSVIGSRQAWAVLAIVLKWSAIPCAAWEPREQDLIRALHHVQDPIQFSPDGRWVFSQSGLAVNCWSAAEGRLVGSFPTTVPALSPDGSTLATVRYEPLFPRELRIVLWSLETRMPIREWKIRAGDDEPRCMAFAAGGDEIVVVTSSWERTRTDMARYRVDGTHIRTATLDLEVTRRSCLLMPDGRTLIADRWIEGGGLRAWRVEDGAELWSLGGRLLDPTLSRDGSMVAARAWDATLGRSDQWIALVSAHDGRLLRTIATAVDPKRGSSDWSSVAFAPDGETLWFGYRQESSPDVPRIRIYPTAGGDLVREIVGRGPRVSVSPEGGLVASGLGDIEVWRADTKEVAWRVGKPGLDEIDAIFDSADGLVVRSVVYGRNSAAVWRLDGDDPVREEPLPADVRAISADGRLVARWNGDGAIHVSDRKTGISLLELPTKGLWGSVLFSPDSEVLLLHNRDLKSWRLADGTLMFEKRAVLNDLTRWPPPTGHLDGGRVIATAGVDVRLWNAADGELIRTLATGNAGGSDRVTALAASDDGMLLAAANADGRALVWDVGTWEQGPAIVAHAARINDVAFLPGSRVLVTASDDRTVVFWCATTGARLETLDRRDPVLEVVPSRSGRALSVRQLAGVFAFRLDPAMLPGCPEGSRFLRADSDGDGWVGMADAVATLNYLFRGGEPPGCLDAADFNDDERIDLADPILTLSWLYQGGEPPRPLECSGDTTSHDDLGCLMYAACR